MVIYCAPPVGEGFNPPAYLTIIPLWGSKVAGGVNPSPTERVANPPVGEGFSPPAHLTIVLRLESAV